MKRSRYEAPDVRDLARIILAEWRDEVKAHEYGTDDVLDVALHLYDAQRLTPRPWLVTFGEEAPRPAADVTATAEIELRYPASHRNAERIAYDLLDGIRDHLTHNW